MQLKIESRSRALVDARALVWALMIVLAFGAMTAFFIGVAGADAPSLTERIAAIVPRFGSKKVPLVDANEFATAVDTACKHERECAARLVTMAIMESGLSSAVSRSEYTPHQGDAYIDRNGVRVHRAWGSWQLHKSSHNADVWGSDDLLVQARAARAMQMGALVECHHSRGLDPDVGMWRILSGRGCRYSYSGEDARQQLLAKIRGRL